MKTIIYKDDDFDGLIDNSEFEVVESGKSQMKEFSGVTDGYSIEYDINNGFTVRVLLNKVTEKELDCFRGESGFEIAFTSIDECGILCLKFGSLPWGDANFEPCLYEFPLDFPNIEDYKEKGFAFNIVVVDPSEHGLVKGIRNVDLGHSFSVKFKNWCENRWLAKPKFNKEKYFGLIESIRQRYSPNALNSMALFRWKLNNDGTGKERRVVDRADGR